MYAFPGFYNFDQQIDNFLQTHKNVEFLIFCLYFQNIMGYQGFALPYSKAFDQEFWPL